MKIVIFICALSSLLFVDSPYGSSKNDLSDNRIHRIMETDSMPIFIGGYSALLTYLDNNFTYPDVYNEASIQGKVICKFIVAEDGSISDVKVIQSLDKLLDEEVVRVIKSMPKWIPGKSKGKAVKVEYYLPVICRIK